MKSILKFVFAAAAIGIASLSAEPVNKKCPVSGEDVDPEVTSKHTVVIGFCCEKCQAKFKEDPTSEKFAAAVKAAAGKPVNAKCPVSGKDIDAEKTVVYKGQTIAFCCGKCPAGFEKDPAKYIAKVKADHPANEKCPVSGKDVDVATASSYEQEIAFCCEKCQAKFDKEPDKYIAKVSLDAETEKAEKTEKTEKAK